MIKTTVEISGMACGMCEAHINDAIRAAFPVKKVTSSRTRGETVILSEAPIDRVKLKKTIRATGYIMLGASEEIINRKSPFDLLLKRQP